MSQQHGYAWHTHRSLVDALALHDIGRLLQEEISGLRSELLRDHHVGLEFVGVLVHFLHNLLVLSVNSLEMLDNLQAQMALRCSHYHEHWPLYLHRDGVRVGGAIAVHLCTGAIGARHEPEYIALKRGSFAGPPGPGEWCPNSLREIHICDATPQNFLTHAPLSLPQSLWKSKDVTYITKPMGSHGRGGVGP